MWVGHELSGHNLNALFAEVGNEIGDHVGRANGIRAHITYMKKTETLHTVCPAQWKDQNYTVYLEVGESGDVVLAYHRGIWWSSTEHDAGVDLRPCSEIQLRFLDTDGKLTREPIIFDCSFGNSWEQPMCKQRQAAS